MNATRNRLIVTRIARVRSAVPSIQVHHSTLPELCGMGRSEFEALEHLLHALERALDNAGSKYRRGPLEEAIKDTRAHLTLQVSSARSNVEVPSNQPESPSRTRPKALAPRPPRQDEVSPKAPAAARMRSHAQERAVREAEAARAADLTPRERMVKIGRGNQQAGRQ